MSNVNPQPTTSRRLAFPSRVGPEEVDSVFYRPLTGKRPLQLLLDLSETEHIEPAALLYLIAACASAKSQGLVGGFALELPKSRPTRDFLRRWKFGQSLARVLQLDVRNTEMLSAGSLKYRSEDEGSPSTYGATTVLTPEGNLEELTSRRFFSTRIHHLDQMAYRPDEFAEMEQGRWEAPDIRAVLERHLGKQSSLVAPGVIYEAIMNAAFHPGATTVIVMSALNERASQKYPNGLLSISIWDDGVSITNTLRAAFDNKQALRAEEFRQYYDWYALYKARPGSTNDWQHYSTLHSAQVQLNSDSVDFEWLLAATFPGVSSAHGRVSHHDEAGDLGPGWEKSGMGLYILTAIAIDSFGGELALRGGRGFINLKRAEDFDQAQLRCHYRCNATLSPQKALPFLGNQVTVRIPLLRRSGSTQTGESRD